MAVAPPPGDGTEAHLLWHPRAVALFKRKKRSTWNWDPVAANIDGPQAWALLTNAVYFQAAARRLDTLGGGLEDHDWDEGLAAWWDVRNEREFDELIEWTTDGGGYRAQWADRGVDGGDEKLAWDYCRVITVAGGAALAQVITAKRAWGLVLDAADMLGERFDSWSAVGHNYLEGRYLWLEDHSQADDASQMHFADVADLLSSDPESPWNRVDWDRSGGVRVDGVVLR